MSGRVKAAQGKPPRPICLGMGGFTLIELVVVMVLVGILAAIAAPRFLSTSIWATRGYLDAARAGLEFGRQTAIAQRRWVCITVSGGLTFARSNRAGDDDATPCASTQALALPGSGASSLTPASGVTVSLLGGASSPLVFNSLGQLVNTAGVVQGQVQLQVSGEQNYTLTIDGATGYVR